MNTIENNKIIAEFMGLKKFQSQLDYTIYDIPQHKIDVVTEQNGGTLFAEMDLKYHSDWNWLMPVLSKCLEGEAEHNDNIANETIKVMYEHLCDQDINGVFESCVKFIKWHNEQK